MPRTLPAPGSLRPGLSQLSLPSPFTDTGKCLSRAKTSPRAQLSCSKVGGVESCFLSCPAHTLFVPGNPAVPEMGCCGRGFFFPGVPPLLPAVLQERARPRNGGL